jgi:dolichol-phosphate mannosyltransferase
MLHHGRIVQLATTFQTSSSPHQPGTLKMIEIQQSPLVPLPSGPLQVSRLPHGVPPNHPEAASLESPLQFSLIIPTYNECGNVEKIIHCLTQLLEPILPNQYELIIVDDNSPDRTWAVAQTLTAQYPQLRVMRRQTERGLSTAVIRGWQVAQGEILGVIDGDLQHPPEILLKMLTAIEQGADLAVASRHVKEGGVSDWSLTRRILSRGAQLLGLMVLPNVIGRVSDPMSGYFMIRRSAIAGSLLSPLGYKILIEVMGRGNVHHIAEIGYIFQERKTGESKVTSKQYLDYLGHLVRLRIATGRLGKLQRKLDFPIARFIRFGVVGLSGVVVNMAGFHVLYGVWGLHMTRSVILSASLAIINNFVWNDLWTFGDISRQQRQWHKTAKRFVKFSMISLMGLILNVMLLNLLFNLFQINPYIANLTAIALVTIWNFWINLKLSWRVTAVK